MFCYNKGLIFYCFFREKVSFIISMEKQSFKQLVADFFYRAGIAIDGPAPWDIRVHDERFYTKLIAEQSLGLGEAYVDGWIDCEAIDVMIFKILRSHSLEKERLTFKSFFQLIKARIMNPQTYLRSFEVGKKHYDLDNDLFAAMLDQRMIYSCAYWKEAKNLDEAQEAKLDLVCKKLLLKPGMTVLDIGCGWGGFAEFAAKKYGVSVLGITVSNRQCEFARERTQGLPVEIRYEDYRKTRGSFDRIVSIGQFEHVGYKNYAKYMTHVRSLLKDDGLFLLHTIGNNLSRSYGEPWMVKYIFPNSMTPSIVQICQSFEGKWVMEDWHNFGPDYDKTLMAWHRNFAEKWPVLASQYSAKFYRMWRYYLLSCAGAFRARSIQLWQIVLSKNGLVEGYPSLR
ncbi:Cyclopropane-fatty-acyl-phospholipid synthase [Chlamydiales bacterium STE3]|nr:Cyclopropane-fatty-acyl-phospholipid synthase [Chlamydiales bacterium STE3]